MLSWKPKFRGEIKGSSDSLIAQYFLNKIFYRKINFVTKNWKISWVYIKRPKDFEIFENEVSEIVRDTILPF